MFRKAAREFAETKVAPHVEQMEKTGEVSDEVVKALGEAEMMALTIAKYFTTEAAQKAAKMAVDIHGGYGCMEEYAVTRFLRDSFVLGPSAGTSDIMKVIIGRWVLA